MQEKDTEDTEVRGYGIGSYAHVCGCVALKIATGQINLPHQTIIKTKEGRKTRGEDKTRQQNPYATENGAHHVVEEDEREVQSKNSYRNSPSNSRQFITCLKVDFQTEVNPSVYRLPRQTRERMHPLQALSLTLLSLLAVEAQTFHSGKCPVPSLQQDFSVAQYLGRWYEIEKFPAVFQKGTCSQATYSLNSDGTVKVLNEELLSDGSVGAIEGYAKVVDPSEPAKLEVVFFEGGPPGKYWVLSTDYDSYSLVYSCTDYEGLFHVEFAWILSRTRSLPGETIARLHETLTSQGISIDKITVTEQAGCSVMPE